MSVYLNNEAERGGAEVPGLKSVIWRSQVQQARAALDALESYAIGRGDDEGARSFAKCIRKILVEVLTASPASPSECPALPRETVKSEVSATDAKLSGAWHKPSQLLTAERMADYLNRTLARGVTITSEIIECAALICGPSPEVTEEDREWARRASEIPEIKAGLPDSALTALPGGGRSSSVADSAPSLHGDDTEAEGR